MSLLRSLVKLAALGAVVAAILYAAAFAIRSPDCFHADERYSTGARVEFTTGTQVCRAGEWVQP